MKNGRTQPCLRDSLHESFLLWAIGQDGQAGFAQGGVNQAISLVFCLIRFGKTAQTFEQGLAHAAFVVIQITDQSSGNATPERFGVESEFEAAVFESDGAGFVVSSHKIAFDFECKVMTWLKF